MTKYAGVLTAGGDTPGLNAALRSLGKYAHQMDIQLIGGRMDFSTESR